MSNQIFKSISSKTISMPSIYKGVRAESRYGKARILICLRSNTVCTKLLLLLF